jgi:predicted GH43/DUF377 family glycosyl hydrolase
MFVVKRSHHNPLFIPLKDNLWESVAAFNWCPIRRGSGKNSLIHCVYRAMGTPDSISPGQGPSVISTVGHTTSKDGFHFENRRQLIKPDFDWEKYGCEDPRVTFFEGKYYIFYTALSTFPFDAKGIKVAVAVTSDFNKIEEKHLVTPFNAKAMTMFPERIGGKIVVMFTVNSDQPPAKTAFAELDKIEDLWNENFWQTWYKNLDRHIIDLRREQTDHIEVGAPPLKTKLGWLLVYSHIQHYFEGQKVFGIEVLLLDINNPAKIIAQSKGPLIVPEEIYEQYGLVSGITFPSGALIEKATKSTAGVKNTKGAKGTKGAAKNSLKKNLFIYYGAADTTSARAEVDLDDLLDSLTLPPDVIRFENNPILEPEKNICKNSSTKKQGDIPENWQAKAVFNPAAIDLDGKVRILYRAMSDDNTSTVGYAESADGIHIDLRLPEPIYLPREAFEMKRVPNGNSGCEDPRIMKIGERIYMTYTAYNGVQTPAVAVTSIAVTDFLKKKWNWDKPYLVSPIEIDDKDSCILPEKVDGHYVIFHRVGTVICADYVDTLDFSNEKINKCIEIMKPRPGMWDGRKVGIAAPPIKTKKGWLLFYHGISERNIYRLGVALLDLKDPTEVISRITDAILWPEMPYEKSGQVTNVVFPCGAILRKDIIYIYYGAGDSVTCGAIVKLSKIVEVLTRN